MKLTFWICIGKLASQLVLFRTAIDLLEQKKKNINSATVVYKTAMMKINSFPDRLVYPERERELL